ncbi:MAG: translocation/assembly module TamB domain-containing protein [Nitrospiria bacterium]
MSKKWVLFSCVAALLIGIHFFLQSRGISEKITHYVQARISSKIHQPVQMEDLKLHFLSSSVVLKGFSIHSEQASNSSSFFAKKIEVAFSPWSFFTETFLIRKIVVESPAVVWDQPSSSDKNIFFQGLQKDRREKLHLPVLIRSLQIKNGHVTFKSRENNLKVILSETNSEIRPDLMMRRFEIDLLSEKGTFAINDVERKIDQLNVDLVVQNDRIELVKAYITSSEATVLTTGSIKAEEGFPLDLTIEAYIPLQEADLRRWIESDDSILVRNNVSGDVSFSGQLRGTYPDFDLEGKLALPRIVIGRQKIGFFKGDIFFKEKKLTLMAFDGELFSGSFTGQAEAAFSSTLSHSTEEEGQPQFAFALQYNNISMEESLSFFSKRKPRQNELLKGIYATGDINFSRSTLNGKHLQIKGHWEGKRNALLSPPLPAGSKRLPRVVALFQTGQFDWVWKDNKLLLTQGDFLFPDTRLSFHGDWQSTTGLRLDTIVKSNEMSAIAMALKFPLTGQASLQGAFRFFEKAPAFDGKLTFENWALRGQKVQRLTTKVQLHDKQFTFKQGKAKGSTTPSPEKRAVVAKNQTKPSTVLFEGTLDLQKPKQPRFQFHLNIHSVAPRKVFKFYRLSIPFYTKATGQLSIQGTPNDFSVTGPLSVSKGTLYGENFEEGRLDLTVTEKAVQLKNVLLKRGESLLAGNGAIRYDRTYRLSLKADHLRIQETKFLKSRTQSLTGNIGLIVTGKGSFEKPQMKFVAAVKNIHYSGISGARGTIKAYWLAERIELEGNFPEQHFSLAGEILLRKGYPFSFETRFDKLRLDPLFKDALSGPFSDVTLQTTGTLSGQGELSRLRQITLNGLFSDLSAEFGTYEVQNDGPVKIHAVKGAFLFENTRLKGKNTSLVINGKLTLLKKWDLFLKGRADLNLLSFFTDEVIAGRGKALLDLSISDDWDKPRILGNLSLKGGTIRTGFLPQTLKISSMTLLFNERDMVLETLDGHFGGGEFRASGKAKLVGLNVGDFGFLLEMDNARMNLIEDLPATVGGELFFQKRGNKQTLKGDLTLGKMVYDKKIDLGSLIIDSINKSKARSISKTPLIGQTAINLHLSGNEGVWIANNLAKIPLGIDLSVKGSFNNPTIIGRIDASSGTMYFRNNTFRILSGSVDFLNPNEIKPILNMTAKTNVRSIVSDRNYEIDLTLSGSLAQMTLSLTSFPSLPEADILALLTIGKTTADLDDVEGGAGTEASSFVASEFLGAPIEQLVGEPVENITGIDRIQVDPYVDGTNAKSTAGTRFTAEKRLLKDQLIVIYSTTLDPSEEDLIRMVYQINNNISLIGKRDDEGQVGGDIRFRFEFR